MCPLATILIFGGFGLVVAIGEIDAEMRNSSAVVKYHGNGVEAFLAMQNSESKRGKTEAGPEMMWLSMAEQYAGRMEAPAEAISTLLSNLTKPGGEPPPSDAFVAVEESYEQNIFPDTFEDTYERVSYDDLKNAYRDHRIVSQQLHTAVFAVVKNGISGNAGVNATAVELVQEECKRHKPGHNFDWYHEHVAARSGFPDLVADFFHFVDCKMRRVLSWYQVILSDARRAALAWFACLGANNAIEARAQLKPPARTAYSSTEYLSTVMKVLPFLAG